MISVVTGRRPMRAVAVRIAGAAVLAIAPAGPGLSEPSSTPELVLPGHPELGIIVHIGAGALSPVFLRVKEGIPVVWRNEDSFAHGLFSKDARFASGAIAPSGSFSHTFVTPGRYDYASVPSGPHGIIEVVP